MANWLRETRVDDQIAGNEQQVTSYNPFRAVRPNPAIRIKVMREFAASGNLEMMGLCQVSGKRCFSTSAIQVLYWSTVQDTATPA